MKNCLIIPYDHIQELEIALMDITQGTKSNIPSLKNVENTFQHITQLLKLVESLVDSPYVNIKFTQESLTHEEIGTNLEKDDEPFDLKHDDSYNQKLLDL